VKYINQTRPQRAPCIPNPGTSLDVAEAAKRNENLKQICGNSQDVCFSRGHKVCVYKTNCTVFIFMGHYSCLISLFCSPKGIPNLVLQVIGNANAHLVNTHKFILIFSCNYNLKFKEWYDSSII
jgi:hypothetical protein